MSPMIILIIVGKHVYKYLTYNNNNNKEVNANALANYQFVMRVFIKIVIKQDVISLIK